MRSPYSRPCVLANPALPPPLPPFVDSQDDTHFPIAMAALRRGLHVLVTKPPVRTLEEHLQLMEAARVSGSVVLVEVHKRYDPIYTDARDRIRTMGDFSFMQSYMSQPKKQLHTFKSWIGKSSDISYYLNSHHVDFHEVRPAAYLGSWCL